ncbi:MAG: SAM-dependent methyltransferase [Bacteroidales bacterium]|nr:SAM-dependent methyltransferase [Bacteroidales bacterium]MCF8405032.1 SAM-dependent methyltransferase [Bacteroidales bacterium]
MKKGTIYLFPSFLAETNDASLIPLQNIKIMYNIDHFIVESMRTARRFMRKAGFDRDFNTITFYELNKHTPPEMIRGYLDVVLNGKNLGIISEAGTPCIADPGSIVVFEAHQLDIRVVPLPGLSSIFMALMASGFNGQNFSFHAYLPIDKKERQQKIKELENLVYKNDQTQIFMETPYRNNQLFESLIQSCQPVTFLCVASLLSHDKLEYIKTKTISDWGRKPPDLNKKPTIFLLYKLPI